MQHNISPAARLRLRAITLTELLIVMAIMGILILVAYPLLNKPVQTARQQEAKLNLSHIANLQKVYFMEHAVYASELKALGFEQEAAATEGGKAHYKFALLEAGNANFKAQATALTDFDADGQFNVWQVDKNGIPKEVVED